MPAAWVNTSPSVLELRRNLPSEDVALKSFSSLINLVLLTGSI